MSRWKVVCAALARSNVRDCNMAFACRAWDERCLADQVSLLLCARCLLQLMHGSIECLPSSGTKDRSSSKSPDSMWPMQAANAAAGSCRSADRSHAVRTGSGYAWWQELGPAAGLDVHRRSKPMQGITHRMPRVHCLGGRRLCNSHSCGSLLILHTNPCNTCSWRCGPPLRPPRWCPVGPASPRVLRTSAPAVDCCGWTHAERRRCKVAAPPFCVVPAPPRHACCCSCSAISACCATTRPVRRRYRPPQSAGHSGGTVSMARHATLNVQVYNERTTTIAQGHQLGVCLSVSRPRLPFHTSGGRREAATRRTACVRRRMKVSARDQHTSHSSGDCYTT